MVFNRHIQQGRLSELVGAEALTSDVLLRMMRFQERAVANWFDSYLTLSPPILLAAL